MKRNAPAMTASAVLLGAALAWPVGGCGRKEGVAPIRSHFNRGVKQFDDRQWDAAAASYRRAIADEPDDRRARFNLSVTLELAARDATDAAQAAALRDQALAELMELLERHPDDERALLNVAAMTAEREGPEAGEAYYQTALQAHPRSAEARAAYANFLLRQDRADDAAAQAELALASDAGSFAGTVALGDAKLRQGDLDAAAKAYAKALATAPDQPVVLRTMAQLEFERGRPAEAQVHVRRALLIDPEDPGLHRLAGQIAEQQGQTEQAVYHRWQARDLEPDPERAEQDRQTLARLYERLAATD
ncbi:MAG: tetratricopeptide repeat protein [Planctomycetota bacterium]